MSAAAEPWLEAVIGDAGHIDRTSTAERVADLLRRRITEGDLPPGTRLSEEQLGGALRVSRNTLREAFRLLTHEGLLVHELHRGVFVPRLDAAALVDLYRLRRAIECDVVRSLEDVPEHRLAALRRDVEAGEAAAAAGDWVAAGTANMQFHRDLVALAGSSRMDEVTARLLAELRLAFHAVRSPRALHEPYVARNRRLLGLLEAGDYPAATDELEGYLAASQATLLDAVRSMASTAPTAPHPEQR